MNIKKISTHTFLVISSLIALFSIMLLMKSWYHANDIMKSKQTTTFLRAKGNNIDLSIKKEDFHTDTSTMAIYNLSPENFIVIYNNNQIKMFNRAEFEDFYSEFLMKRKTSFSDLLWRYIELTKLAKLPALKIKKSMGKLYANNSDYTNDMVSYSNFCLSFLSVQENEKDTNK